MSEVFDSARWIWTDEALPNQYVAFVKTAPLPDGGPIHVRITASSYYELYINGEFVAHGPVYGDPQWRLYDELAYTPAADADRLHVVIVAHHETGSKILALRPALGGVLASFAGPDLAFGTDASWKRVSLPMWSPDAPKRGWAMGYAEDYDAAREPDGWQERQFGSAVLYACPNATLVPSPGTIWANYEPRPTPYPRYHSVTPVGFAAFHAPDAGVDAMGEVGEHAEAETLDPVAADQPFALAAVNALSGRANAFTFDLGQEYVGHVEFEIDAPAGRVIEISGAELLRDGRPWIVKKGTRDTVRYRTRAGGQRFRSFGWSGFRYIHFVVRGGAGDVTLRRIGCRERRVTLPPAKPLETADRTLRAIFDLCRRTLEVGVQEHLIDCPTREQAQYWGDAVFIAQSLWHGFGEERYLRWYLDCFLHVPFNAIGQISSVYPGDHAVFVDYSLIPLLGQRFIKENTGSFHRVRETCDKALRLKAWYDGRRDTDGLVQMAAQEQVDGVSLVNFIDHPGLGWHDFPHVGIDRDGVSCPLNLFFYGYLTILAEMLDEAGGAAGAVRREAESLGAAIRARFFDGTVFHDASKEGRRSDGASWQANALAVYLGLVRDDEAYRVMRAMLDRYDTVCRCSPYFHFYFLFALHSVGLHEEAIALIKREWRPMLDGGATTTWEGFLGDAKDTLCHPWSTAPFLYLLKHQDSRTSGL